MPIVDLHCAPDDAGRVLATMHFPKNKELREQYVALNRITSLIKGLKETDKIEIDVKTLNHVIDAASFVKMNELCGETTKKGVIAGDILSTIYLMDLFNIQEPSMNKAIHVAQEYAKTTTYNDGTKLNTSERMIRKYWREFMSVAHFWAAVRLNQSYTFCAYEETFSNHDNFKVFLEVSAELLNFGCNFVPKRTRQDTTILNRDNVWALPSDIPRRTLVSEEIPDELLKHLETYKAPPSLSY